MTLAAMLADLPTACSTGIKRNAKGHNVAGSATSCISIPPMAISPCFACSLSGSVTATASRHPLGVDKVLAASPTSMISWTALTRRAGNLG